MLHGNDLHYASQFILSTSVVIHFICITEHYNGTGAFLYCVLSLSAVFIMKLRDGPEQMKSQVYSDGKC
jgi:hypothetical protein